jgi:hypothetical protein
MHTSDLSNAKSQRTTCCNARDHEFRWQSRLVRFYHICSHISLGGCWCYDRTKKSIQSYYVSPRHKDLRYKKTNDNKPRVDSFKKGWSSRWGAGRHVWGSVTTAAVFRGLSNGNYTRARVRWREFFDWRLLRACPSSWRASSCLELIGSVSVRSMFSCGTRRVGFSFGYLALHLVFLNLQGALKRWLASYR